MNTDINARLELMCSQLNGTGSRNYAANVHLYHCPGLSGQSVKDIVSAALGWTVLVQSSSSIDRQGLFAELNAGLEYIGDDGAHPNRDYIRSAQFKTDEESVLEFFNGFLADADQLISFYLKEGHPFYPVFWDFAFLIEKCSDAFVLIGSSSD